MEVFESNASVERWTIEENEVKYYEIDNCNRIKEMPSDKLLFSYKRSVPISAVYCFLKELSEGDIELYRKSIMKALNNVEKMRDEKKLILLKMQNERTIAEDYINNFREKYVKKKENK